MIEFNATFLVSMISFVVFIIIMNAIFYNPILNIIKKRDEYIDSNYKDSESNIEKIENIEKTYRSEYEKAKSASRKVLNAEIEQSQKDADIRISEAKHEARNVVKSKKEDLFIEAQNLKCNLEQNTVEDLSNLICSKIMEVK